MTLSSMARGGVSLTGEPVERLTVHAAARETELFDMALRAASSLELDWLWLYMQLSDRARRRYCLERALSINPQSAIARREMEMLEHTA
ncbi:MAG: hypothetical protein HGA45_03790 [Chloroflexales bacterium]|nr:hypothetical protein [Chloroflexales bacterium]